MRNIDLYNPYHLGDSVFMMILFYNIKEYIEKKNIIINYYCIEELHKQLSEFICTNNIKLLNYTENNIGLNCWINNNNFTIHWSDWLNNNNHNNCFNDFYIIFFNQLLDILNINQKIIFLSYKDEDLINRYNKFNDKYKNIDFLVINSVPMSGQFNYNENEWNIFCTELNKKYKIITTKKVSDIFCTLDENLTIKDIAALSTNIKKIISVNTGVLPGLLNEYTLNNIEVLYYFDNKLNYSYSKFKKINDIKDLNFLYDTFEKFNNTIYVNYNNILLLLLLLVFFILFYFIKKSPS
jgi:hypothetical protein